MTNVLGFQRQYDTSAAWLIDGDDDDDDQTSADPGEETYTDPRVGEGDGSKDDIL